MSNLESRSKSKSVRRHYEVDFIQQVVGVYQNGVYKTVKDCAAAYTSLKTHYQIGCIAIERILIMILLCNNNLKSAD